MRPTPTQNRERLASLALRKSKARDQRAAAREAQRAAREANDTDALAVATTAFEQAHEELAIVQALEGATMRQMVGGVEDFGAALVDNPDAQRVLTELAGSTAAIRSNVHIGPLLTMEQTCGLTGRALIEAALTLPTEPTPGRDNGYLGIQPTPVVPARLLDVFRSVPFDGRRADFLRRNGGIANAGIQAEGAVKAQADITYSDESVEAVTIASWIKANRQSIDDIGGLLPDMTLALNQGVMLQVEELLLHGVAASGAPTPGILESDVLEATVTATNLADAVGQAKAQLAVTGIDANFVAANPLTIEEEEERTADGSGVYVNTITPDGRIRRLPLVPSIALDEGEVLLGDSRIGARLGVRSPVSAVVGQESDDLVRNKVTLLVEGRWAPIVDVPRAFAHFTL